MNIYDFMSIFCFLILVGIILVKLYNIFTACKAYDIKFTYIGFISFLLFWLVQISILMIQPERSIFVSLMNISNLLLVVNIIFLIVEVLITVGVFATGDIEPYKGAASRKY